MNEPLAERLRPKKLSDYLSQQHLIGKNGALTQQIKQGIIPSLILWGPPGVGKTTLANIIATESQRPFYTLSAVSSGVKDVREIIEKAKKGEGLFTTRNPILFIDEIHRFSKSQQDSLLGAVEKGWVTLIGATTENPSFEVISALLSRCQVYVLKPFEKEELIALLNRAIEEDTVIKSKKVELIETEALLRLSGGDARKLLNIFELLVTSAEGTVKITNQMVLDKVQQNTVLCDKNGAVYWLARMIEGGEDVKFIARRLLILASEDIGNANPTALIMANNTFQAVNIIGFPESRIILSQCVIYLATSPKSNASYTAISQAQSLVKQTGNLSVPLPIRNAPTKLMKDLGYGDNYKYSHNFENNFAEAEFLPEEIKNTVFYNPGNNQREQAQREFLKKRWKNKYGY